MTSAKRSPTRFFFAVEGTRATKEKLRIPGYFSFFFNAFHAQFLHFIKTSEATKKTMADEDSNRSNSNRRVSSRRHRASSLEEAHRVTRRRVAEGCTIVRATEDDIDGLLAEAFMVLPGAFGGSLKPSNTTEYDIFVGTGRPEGAVIAFACGWGLLEAFGSIIDIKIRCKLHCI